MKISDVIQELARIISENGDMELPDDFWIRKENGELKID